MPKYVNARDVVLDVRAMQADERRIFECTEKRVSAAVSILGRFLGSDWLPSRLRLLKKGKGDVFLKPAILKPLDQFKSNQRVVELAEHLLNLQDVDGFEVCLREIETDKIETGLAKLVAARMLRFRGIPFRFVPNSGIKGADYDAEAIVAGVKVAVEMKAKVEGKALRPGAIVNTLKVARNQVPEDTPNVVFLRVPDAWGMKEADRQQVVVDIESEFRNSTTFNAIVVHWERWSELTSPESSMGGLVHDRFMVAASGRPRVQLPELAKALATPDEAAGESWISLETLLCRPEELERLVPVPPAGGLPFYGDKLTAIGPARLAYAHFCDRVYPDPVLPTWERVRVAVQAGGEKQQLPEGSTIVLRIEESGPSIGNRNLTIPFGRHADDADADQQGEYRQMECPFVDLGPHSPRVAVLALDVTQVKLNGPGWYAFDFVLGDQALGRLPVLIYQDALSVTGPAPALYKFDRVVVKFGHVMEGLITPDQNDPEGAVSFQRILETVSIDKSAPFTLNPALFVFCLSAPDSLPRQHLVEVVLSRSDGTLVGSVQLSMSLQPGPPGELVASHVLSLTGLVFPGEGDYRFLIKVDGKDAGRVAFFARVRGSTTRGHEATKADHAQEE